jgi:hypothetical protein
LLKILETMVPVAKFIQKHTSDSTIYTPVFTDTNPSGAVLNGGIPGSVGTYSPSWFGVHNAAAVAQDVTIWTIAQGTSGTGVTVKILAGETFYAQIAKLTAATDGTIVLLGTTNLPSMV